MLQLKLNDVLYFFLVLAILYLQYYLGKKLNKLVPTFFYQCFFSGNVCFASIVHIRVGHLGEGWEVTRHGLQMLRYTSLLCCCITL